jgi:hypothetical protein
MFPAALLALSCAARGVEMYSYDELLKNYMDEFYGRWGGSAATQAARRSDPAIIAQFMAEYENSKDQFGNPDASLLGNDPYAMRGPDEAHFLASLRRRFQIPGHYTDDQVKQWAGQKLPEIIRNAQKEASSCQARPPTAQVF